MVSSLLDALRLCISTEGWNQVVKPISLSFCLNHHSKSVVVVLLTLITLLLKPSCIIAWVICNKVG